MLSCAASQSALTDLSEHRQKTCWIVTDGAIGNEKQCQALVHYLDVSHESFRVVLREPWNSLAPHFRQGGRRAITGPLRERLDGELPDLLITAGRRATLVSTTVRRLSGGNTLTVHVLDPRIDSRHFDLVICPLHDRAEGDNVIKMQGAPHKVDEQTLAEAREEWSQLGALPAPRVALLIGASNRAYTVTEDYLQQLAEAIEQRIAGGGSLLVTTSRRTSDPLREFVEQRFHGKPGHVWTGIEGSDNPYMGYLGWADRIFVTADSVNMVSEACGTGRPVHCEPPGKGNPKFQRFHKLMRENGHVLTLDSADEQPYEPLRETRDVARQIAALMSTRDTQ